MAAFLILYDKCDLPKNSEIFFFNELIKSHYLKDKKEIDDYKTLSPYGLSEELLKRDAEYLSKIYDKFIIRISNELNRIHGLKKSSRYWSIILGKWLRDFTYATYNRYQTIKKGLNKYEINEVILIKDKENSFPIIDATTFNYYSNDRIFDAILISNIFKSIKLQNDLKISYSEKDFFEEKKQSKYKNGKKNFLPVSVYNLLSRFKDNRKSDFFVISSYFLLREELKLNFYLNNKLQFFYYPHIRYKKSDIDQNLRNELSFKDSPEDEFESLLNKILSLYLPLTVLENFTQIKDFIKNLRWPDNPKMIFSSNSFADGGPTQFWIAEKIEQGSKYYLGQHGAGYLEYYDKKFRAEIKPVDGFITWGNHKFSKKIYPAFNFTMIGKKNNKTKKKALFVFKSSGNRIVPYDRFEYGKIIFDQSQYLISNLNDKIKENLMLRLHSSYKKEIYFNFDNFLKNNSSLKIDKETSFNKLITSSKITIYNDFSTGFVYGLNMNLPSVIFLPLDLKFIHEENKKDFNKLIENQMIFTSVEKLKDYLNNNWDRIEENWNRSGSQLARNLFLENYSRFPPINKIKDFSEILKNLK